MFVTDKEDKDTNLTTMIINLEGRDKLWGKTKTMFNNSFNESDLFDWVLKVSQNICTEGHIEYLN